MKEQMISGVGFSKMCGVVLVGIVLVGVVLLFSPLSFGASPSLYHSPAADNPHFRKVISRIQIRRSTLRSFAQKKTIEKLERTLHSSGALLITPTGVCWRNETPFVSFVRMTADGIETARPGEPVRFERSDRSADIEKFVGIMLALFSADESKLKRAFDFYFMGDNDAWTIGFKPSRRELSRLITAVELSGTRDVEKIVIREANGDISEIIVTSPPLGKALSLERCIE